MDSPSILSRGGSKGSSLIPNNTSLKATTDWHPRINARNEIDKQTPILAPSENPSPTSTMSRSTEGTHSESLEMVEIREELEQLKRLLSEKQKCDTLAQDEEEASIARAKNVTLATLNENQWSFLMPEKANLSSAVNWTLWFDTINSSLDEINLEIRDLKHLEHSAQVRSSPGSTGKFQQVPEEWRLWRQEGPDLGTHPGVQI
ncbi:hypothetical protein CFIMG_007943RA [Ceratocystis fimbriata CBS 114723]|uniref:Uncharacterized protein n=1 Tax=Ceratocystis fimbriata CBS 114723 TaxID=1035309 RepID=A0A2C5WU12_9PEZI|nr:hypothetical protein CFIMG_007943RA [Ceratocystis fimbriata CBS 114723]